MSTSILQEPAQGLLPVYSKIKCSYSSQNVLSNLLPQILYFLYVLYFVCSVFYASNNTVSISKP